MSATVGPGHPLFGKDKDEAVAEMYDRLQRVEEQLWSTAKAAIERERAVSDALNTTQSHIETLNALAGKSDAVSTIAKATGEWERAASDGRGMVAAVTDATRIFETRHHTATMMLEELLVEADERILKLRSLLIETDQLLKREAGPVRRFLRRVGL